MIANATCRLYYQKTKVTSGFDNILAMRSQVLDTIPDVSRGDPQDEGWYLEHIVKNTLSNQKVGKLTLPS